MGLGRECYLSHRRSYINTLELLTSLENSVYSLGAILFWPVAHFSVGTSNPKAIFAGFVLCTAVTACGLATVSSWIYHLIVCYLG